MRRVTVGRSGIRHNGVEYATEVRPRRRIWVGAHTEKCKKLRQRRKREENLRGIERASSCRWINLVEDVRKTQRGQRTKVEHSASSVSLSYRTVLYPIYVHCSPIAGLKLVISSYSNSFNCSRLMSSLCTVPKSILISHTVKWTPTVKFKKLRIQWRRHWLIVWVVLAGKTQNVSLSSGRSHIYAHKLQDTGARVPARP